MLRILRKVSRYYYAITMVKIPVVVMLGVFNHRPQTIVLKVKPSIKTSLSSTVKPVSIMIVVLVRSKLVFNTTKKFISLWMLDLDDRALFRFLGSGENSQFVSRF